MSEKKENEEVKQDNQEQNELTKNKTRVRRHNR